ncbi:MAG: hypothetical protein GYB65_10340 [Chloroflexi bacterium]|nr:hypothetical protein [Chloroflexota bacterium]
MLQVTAKEEMLWFGERFGVTFERTLRIPDDGKTYPLPPSLGHFPIKRVKDYAERVPDDWREHGGVFIPMYQREALWLNFFPQHWKPNAVKIAVGKINAVSGQPWSQELHKKKKDYMVCPPQPWLDGINAGRNTIRQFVAMPLGMGYTVEGQVTGEERFGGIQIIVYEPKPGKFPDEPPLQRFIPNGDSGTFYRMALGGAEMGLGAGGKMRQKIYPDPHGIDTWDAENYGRVYVHIVNSLMYREITGEEPPPTPITTKLYAAAGYPWFDLYDERLDDIAAPENLQSVKSIKEMDADKGFAPQQDDDSVNVPEDKIIKYPVQDNPDVVDDGDW